MSYTESYRGRVHYSGSESVTYPASEHGGRKTVHYSGDVPVEITIHVNTEPFDASVSEAETALVSVAGILSATEAAQVAAIAEGSERIAQTTTAGFFGLLRSELSSQISEFGSTMRSSVGMLLELSRAVDDIHEQMRKDYHRIQSRYRRVFDRLDQELDRRIKDMDRASFELRERAMGDVVMGSYTEGAGRLYAQTSEMHALPLKLQTARTKGAAAEALEDLADVCLYVEDYQGTVEAVTQNGGDDAVMFVPAIYMVQDTLQGESEQLVVHQAGDARGDDVRAEVMRYVASVPDQQWTTIDSRQLDELDGDYLRLVDAYGRGGGSGHVVASNTDSEDRERVCRLMLQMYQEAGMKTIDVTHRTAEAQNNVRSE